MRLRVTYKKEGRSWRMSTAWWPLAGPGPNIVPFEQARQLIKGAEKISERQVSPITIEREFEVNPVTVP